MKRLTFEGNFCDIAQCTSVPSGSFCENGTCSPKETWERLKAIEDILGEEYELEQIRALPCKMGDMLWGIKHFGRGGYKVRPGRVSEMSYLDDMRLCITLRGVCRGEYGKKVFGTREEAEAALTKGATE